MLLMTPPLPTPAQKIAQTHQTAALTPSELSRIAQGAFRTGPLLLRKLQHYRPYICPFGDLIGRVEVGSAILDVGCGGGLWLALLRETGRIRAGVGFDSSRQAIALAQAIEPSGREGAAALTFQLLPAQAEWPTVAGGAGGVGGFDVVSIIDVLHHVPVGVGPSLFVNAAARLRPGGMLLYKDIYPGSWRSVCNRMHDLVMARQWINLVETATVVEWAERAGFMLRETRTIDTWWYGHVVCVFEKK